MKTLLICFFFLAIGFTGWNQPEIPAPDCPGSISLTYCKNPLIDPNDSLFMLSGKSDELYGLKDENGQEILSCKYQRISIERLFRDSCHLLLNRVILRENDLEYALDLKTKKQTKTFDYLFFSDDRLFGADSSGWVIFDQQLNSSSLFPGTPCIYFSQANAFYPISKIYSKYDYTLSLLAEQNYQILKGTGFSLQSDILAYGVMSEGRVHNSWNPFDFYGLINLQTNQQTDPVYTQIMGLLYGKELFYWAVTIEKEEYSPEKQTSLFDGCVDIYSRDLKKLASYPFAKTAEPFQKKLTYQLYYPEALAAPILLRSENGKMGGVSANGKIVIPFQYDSITKLYTGQYNYAIWKNGKAELLDPKGNYILSGSYFNFITSSDSTRFIVELNADSPLKSLVDCNGQIIIKDYSSVWNLYPDTWSGDFEPKEHLPTQISSWYGAIKDSTFYFFIDNLLYKMDSTNFNFKQPTKIVGQYIVKKNGKIALNSNSFGDLQSFENSCYIAHAYDHYTIVSLDGNHIQELERGSRIGAVSASVVQVLIPGESPRIFDLQKWAWQK